MLATASFAEEAMNNQLLEDNSQEVFVNVTEERFDEKRIKGIINEMLFGSDEEKFKHYLMAKVAQNCIPQNAEMEELVKIYSHPDIVNATEILKIRKRSSAKGEKAFKLNWRLKAGDLKIADLMSSCLHLLSQTREKIAY